MLWSVVVEICVLPKYEKVKLDESTFAEMFASSIVKLVKPTLLTVYELACRLLTSCKLNPVNPIVSLSTIPKLSD